MKYLLIVCMGIMLVASSCSKESVNFDQRLDERTSGPDVCGSVTKLKVVPRVQSDGKTTVTTDYAIKNCTNIVPITIYLDITNRITNQQVKLFSNLPFASKISWDGLTSGDFYQFTVFVIRNDSGELIDAKAEFISIP